MTNRYPLHHEDARPLYMEIPQDEYDRIMTENLRMKETLKRLGKLEELEGA